VKKMQTGIAKTQIMSTRSLVIVLIAVGAVTGGNLWIHRVDPPIGYTRYIGHGISFDYSMMMTPREADLGGFGPATDSGGSVQVSYQGADRLEQYGAMWIEPKSMPSNMAHTPEAALDFLFEFIGLAGTRITDRGEYKTTTTDGHEAIYQTFGVPESDYTIPAIIGAWHCEETGRFLMLYLIYVEDFENLEVPHQGLEQMWLDRLDGITCHGI
jgi:hypothetical protein